MRKNLRKLCLMLIASASSLVSFAQEPQNFTDKLWNHDFEKGPNAWDLVGEGNCSWMSQTKGEKIAVGYHGFNDLALENWRGSGAAPDNQASQTVKNLPNGTYVFGAYMMATTQSREQDIETVSGVFMFANDQEISVATNRVEGMDTKWAHTIKFNVAAEVTDGTLTVGVKCVATNAGFLAMDNATLWYFGDMSQEDALEEMAKIDIAATVEKVTPYLEAGKMNVDTLASLQAAIEAATEVTAETAPQIDEDLYWGKRQVIKSIADYNGLAEAIAAAKEVANKEWSEYVDAEVAALNALIEEVEAAYEAGTAFRAEIDTMKASLTEAVSNVELDGIYNLLEIYTERVDSISDLEGDEIGEYTEDMIERAEEFLDEIDYELSMTGEISATEIKNNCDILFAKIQNIVDNPINYSQFPIFIYEGKELLPNQGSGESNQAYPVPDGTYLVNYEAGVDKLGNAYGAKNNIAEYHSPLYRFREPLTSVRFIVHKSGRPQQVDKNGNANICIGGFAMYDEFGNEIELTTENLISNANEPREGGGIPALIDGNPNTFFHSLWTAGTPEPHYLEVTLPEGQYSAFSFKITSLSSNHTRAFPREMELTYVSPKVTELQQAIVTARKANPLFGTAPGFCNMDPTLYQSILEEGDALTQKKGASDAELNAAIEKVNNLLAEIQEKGVNLPEPGKKYRIISGEPRFFTNQNIMKTLTLHTDTIYGDWLWWETAHPDSARQEFILEPCETETDRLYYTFKHAETGLYLSELFDSVGTLIPNRFVFTEQPDSFYIKNLGYGQFGIFASDANSRKQLNMEFHNNGAWSDQVKNYDAIPGVKSYIHTWDSQANQSSAWFFREMVTLPHATKSISELNFRSDAISIYEGINVVTLTADKDCAFADLAIYNTFGEKVATNEVVVDGKVATIKLANNIETLSFSFANTEGVTEVSVDGINEYRGEAPELLALEAAYNKAVALTPVVGTEVGQVKSVEEYDAAITAAIALLENGGEIAELVSATTALETAVANLECNLPVAGQNYYIISALPWKDKWRGDVAVFAKENLLYWGFVNLNNRTMLWQFVDCGEKKHGYPAYYLYNVGAEAWLSVHSAHLTLVEDTTAQARPWDMRMSANGSVSIGDTNWDNGAASMQPYGHANGTAYPAQNKMSTWGIKDSPEACSWYIVSEEKFIADFMTGIENMDITDEYVAPVQKGIYDLYGRRIMTPAATGIYIVDGKKKVIKK